MMRMTWQLVLLGAVALLLGANGAARADNAPSGYAMVDHLFDEYRLDAHLPGIVYGIVIDGRLVHVAGFGVQDLTSRRPVGKDSLFRIASMTKAFTALTILQLRDEGKLRLDDLAEDYVPEMRNWHYPTEDSPHIRVRDLLNHVGGFVTDDPWGDRQTPMKESDFTEFLKQGVPFNRAPETGYEYSNLGFAILGRIIGNVSKTPFAETITARLLQPLGMSQSGFYADRAPAELRALGYRWEDDQWRSEPFLAHGAFGAMGGIQTNAEDYAKWVGFLLSAWPPRDGAELGPVKRATVRTLAEGSNFLAARARPFQSPGQNCRGVAAYGMGLLTANDCELGPILFHGGGYPGYGSHMLLLPERGVGIFAFANRTYAGPSAPIWEAASTLLRAGLLPPPHRIAPGEALISASRAAAEIYASGNLAPARRSLAMNFLLDRDEAGWAADLARLKAQLGACPDQGEISATGALTGEFTWRCEHGRLKGAIELAPTSPPAIQQLSFGAIKP